MNKIEKYIEEIQDNKEDICDLIILKLSIEYGNDSFDKEICKRDLLLIINCVQHDILADSTISTIKAGLSYIHAYNGIKFTIQKHQLLSAIDMLKIALINFTDDLNIATIVEQRLDILYSMVNEKAVQETRLWSLAGKVLPYTALAGLVWSQFIGHHDLYHSLIVIIATVFFSISVTWWWWAIYKITTIFTILKHTQPRFKEISDNIGSIRQDVSHIHNTVTAKSVDKSK